MLVFILLLTAYPSASRPLNQELFPRNNASTTSDDTRSLQSIVWSCIVTVFACTWVAIHPNLPDPRQSKWSIFKHRLAIMILTIFAPEFIMIWALRQRLAARSIVKEYNSCIYEVEDKEKPWFSDLLAWFRNPPPPRDRQGWTLTHGFYVQMGGFVFHDNATDWPIRVLSFPELLDLIRSGLVDAPTLTEEDLCDKSKGDIFAKLFVVVQTTWFMVQCVVRWTLELPVTELEILTFSFAVLNIITYALWLDKPQNINTGTCIEMRGRLPQSPTQEGSVALPSDTGEVDITEVPQPLHHENRMEGRIDQSPGDSKQSHNPHNPIPPNHPSQGDAMRLGDPETHRSSRISHLPGLALATIVVLPQALYIFGREILRAELFNQFRQVVLGCSPTIKDQSLISTQTIMKHPSVERAVISVVPGPLKVGAFHAHDMTRTGKDKLIIFVVASGLLFGGLHLVPWKFEFPSHTESTIWRISAVYMMANPILLTIPLIIFALLKYHSSPRSRFRSALLKSLPWIMPFVRIITSIAIPLYILARLSIIILAFTTLRSLPPDVYREIPWSSYIPHI